MILVFADPSDRVVTKILYRNDHVISQSSDDFNEIYAFFDGEKDEAKGVFQAQSQSSKKTGTIYVNLSYWKRQNEGFAMEIYTFADNERPDRMFCREKSDEKLKKQISQCFGPIGLRAMSEEESEEMRKFENEQKSNFIFLDRRKTFLNRS